jgi:GMP synthase PP-ATPase subunit
MDTFKNHLHLPVTCIDHSKEMLARLAGLSDPEAKRKAIGGLRVGEMLETCACDCTRVKLLCAPGARNT